MLPNLRELHLTIRICVYDLTSSEFTIESIAKHLSVALRPIRRILRILIDGYAQQEIYQRQLISDRRWYERHCIPSPGLKEVQSHLRKKGLKIADEITLDKSTICMA